jgi:serine protease Do
MSPSYTGAMLEVMGPQLAQFFGVEGRTGLLVRSVENNSPAAQAGMKAGDVVVHANTRTVATMSDWAKTIREAKGRPVSVIVLRDKQEKTLTLTPDGKKRSELELPLEPAPTIRLAYLTEL